MTGVRRALALSLLERYLLIVLALASNVILARILTPAEIGQYSVTLAVIGIAQVLRDFGIGNFLIQQTDLDDDHVRTAFGLSLLIGASLFLLTFVAAPWLARFYAEPAMVSTLRICALNFLLLPFCSISTALLRREMQFQRLLYVALAAGLAAFAVTLALAWRGMGPDSMAAGAVVNSAVTGIGTWLAREDRRLLWPSLARWRQLLNFGAQASAANIVTSVSMDVNDLVLGKLLGFAPVAMISRAQGLAHLFGREVMGAIRNVAYPAFARAHRDGEPMEARCVASTGAVTAVGWPFYGFLALFPLEVMRVMYGRQWDEAASLVPIFAASGAVLALSALINNAMMAVGRVDLVTKGELVVQPLRAAAVVAAAMTFGSLQACAWAALGVLLAYTPMIYAIKQRCIPNDWAALSRHLRASALVTAGTLAVPAAISLQAGWGRDEPVSVMALALAIVAGCLAWPLSLMLTRHPLSQDPLFQPLARRLPLWCRPA